MMSHWQGCASEAKISDLRRQADTSWSKTRLSMAFRCSAAWESNTLYMPCFSFLSRSSYLGYGALDRVARRSCIRAATDAGTSEAPLSPFLTLAALHVVEVSND